MEYPYALTLTPDYLLGVEKNQFVRIPVATDITGGTPMNESRNILTGTQSGPGGAVTFPGAFTASSGAVTLSPANANVVLSPTGTGVVTIAPATAGTINNCSLGVTTPAVVKASDYQANRTDISGTPGNGTASTTRGRAAFAAAGTTVVVTNTLVTATSTVLVQLGGSDSTLTSVRVTPAAGSFTVTGNAAATATTVFDFFVVN